VRDHDAGAGRLEGAGIGGLVIVGGVGIGTRIDGRPIVASSATVEAPAAADHQMARRQTLRQVGEERRQLDDDAARV
jgi:hypothetical protein